MEYGGRGAADARGEGRLSGHASIPHKNTVVKKGKAKPRTQHRGENRTKGENIPFSGAKKAHSEAKKREGESDN